MWANHWDLAFDIILILLVIGSLGVSRRNWRKK